MSLHFSPSQANHGSTDKLQTARELGASESTHQHARHPIFEGVVNLCQAPSFRFNLLRMLCVSALLAFLHDLHLMHEYEAAVFILALAPWIMVRHLAR